MNTATDTLADEVEPFLLRSELVVRTPRGRIATVQAYKHLQMIPPQRQRRYRRPAHRPSAAIVRITPGLRRAQAHADPQRVPAPAAHPAFGHLLPGGEKEVAKVRCTLTDRADRRAKDVHPATHTQTVKASPFSPREKCRRADGPFHNLEFHPPSVPVCRVRVPPNRAGQPAVNPLTVDCESLRIRGLHDEARIPLGVLGRCPDGRPQTKTFQFTHWDASCTRCAQTTTTVHLPAVQYQPAHARGLPQVRLLHGTHCRQYGRHLAEPGLPRVNRAALVAQQMGDGG